MNFNPIFKSSLVVLLLFSFSAIGHGKNGEYTRSTISDADSNELLKEQSLPEGLNMYLRSFSSGQGIDVNLGTVPLNQLETRGFGLTGLAQKVLEEGPSKTVVVLYVPKGISIQDKQEYGNLIIEKLSLAYPQMEFSVQYSFLDPEEGQREMAKDNAIIQQELMDGPQSTPEGKNIGRLMIALNKAKMAFNSVTRISDIKATIKGLKSKSPRQQDIAIATAVGFSKAIINSYAWIVTSHSSGLAAYTSALSSWTLDVWFAKHSQDWVTWKKNSNLTWNRFGFGKLAKIINKSEARRTWLVDQLNGFFWAHYFRTLAYIDNPSAVSPLYSQGAIHDFWIPYVINSFSGGPIGASSQIAINNLRQKGILSQRSQFYTFLAYDANYTTTSFLLSKAMVGAYWTLIIAEWGTRLGFVSANVVLPARSKKIVLIDPRLSKMEHVGILHKEGIELPQESDIALADWEKRTQSFRDPQQMDYVEKGVAHLEKFIGQSYQFLTLANAQRVTGVDLLNIDPYIKKVFPFTCKSILKK